MSFRKVERRPSGKGAVAADFVKARCWGKRFELLFSEDLWMLIGSPEKIAIFVGAGPDAGKIAIEEDLEQGYHCRPASPGARIRRIYVTRDKIGVEPFPSRMLKHRVRGNRLIITLTSSARRKVVQEPMELANEEARRG